MKRLVLSMAATMMGMVTLLVTMTGSASAASSVPIKATYSGTIQITSADPAGNPMSAAYGGTGTGSHLGLSGMQGVITVQGPAPSCGAAGGFTAQHSDTLTAADGSQLLLQVNEVACGISPGSFHCVGTYVVLSGTGRFAGATGSGAFDGIVSFNPDGSGTFNASYSGTVAVAQ